MIISKNNKENIPEQKKSSKQTKKISNQIKPRKFKHLNESHHLQNAIFSHINHSLDQSSTTVRSSRKKSQAKSKLRTRSMNSSEYELKADQKTKKMFPIPWDEPSFKLPKAQKTSKAKNPRKQSQYVSYLIQAQRRVMNSLSSIDNTQFNNCHEVSNLVPLKCNEINQLREQMKGLKERFERLESEQSNIDKETIILNHERCQKGSQTIELLNGAKHFHTIQNLNSTQNYDNQTIEIQKKVEKQITQKYGTIIAQYDKMLNFYKGRMESLERDSQVEKQRQKTTQEQLEMLKRTVKQKENEIQRNEKIYLTQRRQLKEEIGILQKSLNKKNKQLLARNQEIQLSQKLITEKNNEIIQLRSSIVLLKQNNNQMIKQQKNWEDKFNQLDNHIFQLTKQFNQKFEQLSKQKETVQITLREQIQKNEKTLIYKNGEIQAMHQKITKQLQQNFDSQISQLVKQFSSSKQVLQNTLIQSKQELKSKNSQIQILVQLNQQSNTKLQQINSQIVCLKQDLYHKQKNIIQLQNCLIRQSSKHSQSILDHSNSIQKIIKAHQSEVLQKQNEIEKIKTLLINFTEQVKAIKTQLSQNQQYLYRIEEQKQNLNKKLQQQTEIFNNLITKQKEQYNRREINYKQLFDKQKDIFIQQKRSFIKQKQQLNQFRKEKDQELQSKQKIILENKNLIENLSNKLLKQTQQLNQLIKLSFNQRQSLIDKSQMMSISYNSLLQTKQSILSQKEQLLAENQKLNQIIKSNYDLIENMKDQYICYISNKDSQLIDMMKQNEKLKIEKLNGEQILQLKTQCIINLQRQIIQSTQKHYQQLQSIKTKQQDRLLNWIGQIQSVKLQVVQKNKQIQGLINKLQQSAGQLNQKNIFIARDTEIIENQQHKIRRLQNNLNDSNSQINTLKTLNKQIQTHIEKITQQNSSLKCKFQSSQLYYREIIERKDKEINEICILCEENKRQITQSFTVKIDNMTVEIKNQQNIINKKNFKISKLQTENQFILIFKDQIENLKINLSKCLNVQKDKIYQIQKLEEKNQKIYLDLQASEFHSKQLRQKIILLEANILQNNSDLSQTSISYDKLTIQLSQCKQKNNSFIHKISILKEQNQAIISTYNHQLEQRKQIIEDLMKQKRQLYQKLHESKA